MSLDAAKKELAAAKRALSSMRGATSFEVFEEEWRDLLNCLEKLWNKVERGCQHDKNRFQPWQGRFSSLRKKDMLLRYLKQARDADNHSIQEVAEVKPGRRTMNFANPGNGYIEHMEIRNGQVVQYSGDPMIVTDHPPTVEVVKVKNSGSWYNPPASHMGAPLESKHPVLLGELGIKFYEKFLHEADEEFHKTP